MTSVLGKRSHAPTFNPVQEWIEEQVMKIDEIADDDVVVKLDTK